MDGFFENFRLMHVPTEAGSVRLRIGGNGPALLLLHGHPRTHTTWWRVAPLLAPRYTVIAADLPGFGGSYQPSGLKDSSGRAKAAALAESMTWLGFDRFSVAGHDRGSYRAFRLAMDFPERVERLAVIDGVPIYEALKRADWRFARDWFHWFFFAQSEKALAAVTGDPDIWYPVDREAMGDANADDMLAATRNPEVVAGMLADYRAGLEHDFFDDEADLSAGRKLRCPLSVIWSARDDMERLYGDPADPWADWTDFPVIQAKIDSGHHVAEEAPMALAAALASFLGAGT